MVQVLETRSDHMARLADAVEELGIDNFTETKTGRRFGTPYSFKKGAPADLARDHSDRWGEGYVARMTHPEALYLTQLLAKQYGEPLTVRSLDTAMEMHPVEKDTKVRVEGWEWHGQVVYRLGDSLFVLDNPQVDPDEKGNIVYDINGSVLRKSKVVRGAEVVEASEVTVVGGVKATGKTVYEVLRSAGVLREHTGVPTVGGGMYFDNSNYPNTSAVWSAAGVRAFYANAGGPSGEYDVGLARPELVEPSKK